MATIKMDDCCWGALKHGYTICPMCKRNLITFEMPKKIIKRTVKQRSR